MTQSQPIVLMLEDDPDDRFITTSTLEELDLDIHIHFVQTSNDLFNFLETSAPPSLILINFNSAPENAMEILTKLKSIDQLSPIPVIILGESTSAKFISRCYSNGASSFIQKPSSIQHTREKIRSFFNYGFSTAAI